MVIGQKVRKRGTVAKFDGTCPVNVQHFGAGKPVKLGENVDGNAKTVNRGENVERVPSPANASGHGANS